MGISPLLLSAPSVCLASVGTCDVGVNCQSVSGVTLGLCKKSTPDLGVIIGNGVFYGTYFKHDRYRAQLGYIFFLLICSQSEDLTVPLFLPSQIGETIFATNQANVMVFGPLDPDGCRSLKIGSGMFFFAVQKANINVLRTLWIVPFVPELNGMPKDVGNSVSFVQNLPPSNHSS